MARRSPGRVSHAGDGAGVEILVVSQDQSLMLPARQAVDHERQIESLGSWGALPQATKWPHLKVVVVDDELLPASDPWAALTRMRECAPLASLIYVAGRHGFETEIWARSFGISYYASKPVEFERFAAILKNFLKLGTKSHHPR